MIRLLITSDIVRSVRNRHICRARPRSPRRPPGRPTSSSTSRRASSPTIWPRPCSASRPTSSSAITGRTASTRCCPPPGPRRPAGAGTPRTGWPRRPPGASRQYVILGAGLDSFAYRAQRAMARPHRLRGRPPRHPGMEARAASPGRDTGPGRHRASCPADFEHGGLAARLCAEGFDPARPALVSWLGVTMYLTQPAISQTLAELGTLAPGTRADHRLHAAGRPARPGRPELRRPGRAHRRATRRAVADLPGPGRDVRPADSARLRARSGRSASGTRSARSSGHRPTPCTRSGCPCWPTPATRHEPRPLSRAASRVQSGACRKSSGPAVSACSP